MRYINHVARRNGAMRKKATKRPSRRLKEPTGNGKAKLSDSLPPINPSLPAKTRRLMKLIKSWLDDESGYDEETWPWLKKALEEDRLSARRQFRD
jgi:hypothetical protein